MPGDRKDQALVERPSAESTKLAAAAEVGQAAVACHKVRSVGAVVAVLPAHTAQSAGVAVARCRKAVEMAGVAAVGTHHAPQEAEPFETEKQEVVAAQLLQAFVFRYEAEEEASTTELAHQILRSRASAERRQKTACWGKAK